MKRQHIGTQEYNKILKKHEVFLSFTKMFPILVVNNLSAGNWLVKENLFIHEKILIQNYFDYFF